MLTGQGHKVMGGYQAGTGIGLPPVACHIYELLNYPYSTTRAVGHLSGSEDGDIGSVEEAYRATPNSIDRGIFPPDYQDVSDSRLMFQPLPGHAAIGLAVATESASSQEESSQAVDA